MHYTHALGKMQTLRIEPETFAPVAKSLTQLAKIVRVFQGVARGPGGAFGAFY